MPHYVDIDIGTKWIDIIQNFDYNIKLCIFVTL